MLVSSITNESLLVIKNYHYHNSCFLLCLRLKFIDRITLGNGGIDLASETMLDHREKAVALIRADADKILQLIKVQMDNLTMPQCPLYEEVLDTQMFGLSREIDFAVRLGLMDAKEGKAILDQLERELSALYEASQKK